MIRLTDEEFDEFCQFMVNRYGIHLAKKRVLIEYRLMNILPQYNVSNYKEYLRLLYLDKSGKMIEEMLNKITTNYTYFMREPSHFEFITEHILPRINLQNPFYIWIAGCSSGQECYTLAMYLEEYRRKGKELPPVKIIASDISVKALTLAKEAIYPLEAMEKLPEHWQHHYCCLNDDGKTFVIKDIIKNQVTFTYHNLMLPYHKNKFDLIMCRNVLIYFNEVSRTKIYQHFTQCLKPGGYLILGHAEMISQGNSDYEYLRSSIYRLKGT